MEILKKYNRFYIGEEDSPIAFIDFEINENIIEITSLNIVNHLKGEGIAEKLLVELYNYAKENDFIINSQKVFVKGFNKI